MSLHNVILSSSTLFANFLLLSDVGTAYFTSIRRDQKRNFEVLRFLLVTDSGETVSLLSSAGASHDSDGELEQGPASS